MSDTVPTVRPSIPQPDGNDSGPLAGGGEMGALARRLDWSSTPLGPVESWTNSLRTTVGTLLNSRHPMFLFWGPELIQFYNDAYRPSLGGGGRHPRALGMRGREFWTEIWDTIGPQIEQVMATGEATWHEDQYLPIERNGRIEDVWWTYSYSPVRDDDGRINGTLVVCQETTSRVLAERRLRELNRELDVERSRLETVFKGAPTFLAVLRGPTFIFELVNDAYYQLVGYRELIGKTVLDALPEVRTQGFVEQLLTTVYESGESYVGRETPVRLARERGAPPEERFVDFVYLPLLDANNQCTGVVAHGYDVTELVHARHEAERLAASEREARASAELANAAKSQFLANMSHELRTPLNAIAGYTELLEMGLRGPVTELQRADLHRIRRSQQHLLGLINNVLNFAKLEAGHAHFEIEDVDLAPVLEEVLSLVEPQLRSRQLELRAASCPRDLAVRADREKLRQILINLLSNAIKFTDAPGSVAVACHVAGERVRIMVRDTGIGIPPSRLEAIFDPFVQVDPKLAREREGTGLGLAISRDLATGMAGSLAVVSEVGKGSTFTIELPLAPSATETR